MNLKRTPWVPNSEMAIFVLIKAAQGFAVPAHGTGRRTSVYRSREPAENADQDKNAHLWMGTN